MVGEGSCVSFERCEPSQPLVQVVYNRSKESQYAAQYAVLCAQVNFCRLREVDPET